MSGEVYIDDAVLARVRSNLVDVGELLSRPARAMRELDSAAVGAGELARRLDEFGHEWSYGIDKLAAFSDAAVRALDEIDRAFDAADQSLADALRPRS